jgi:hypothetical protein
MQLPYLRMCVCLSQSFLMIFSSSVSTTKSLNFSLSSFLSLTLTPSLPTKQLQSKSFSASSPTSNHTANNLSPTWQKEEKQPSIRLSLSVCNSHKSPTTTRFVLPYSASTIHYKSLIFYCVFSPIRLTPTSSSFPSPKYVYFNHQHLHLSSLIV